MKTHEAAPGQTVEFCDGDGKPLFSVMLSNGGALNVQGRDTTNSANDTPITILPVFASLVWIYRLKDVPK